MFEFVIKFKIEFEIDFGIAFEIEFKIAFEIVLNTELVLENRHKSRDFVVGENLETGIEFERVATVAANVEVFRNLRSKNYVLLVVFRKN